MASLLGASLHLEGASKNEKLSYLFGFRQKSNQYLLQSQPTKGVYNPSFTDVQMLIHYEPGKKWEWEFLGNYARNRFSFYPEEQTTSFGVINQAFQLRVFYHGGEIDQYWGGGRVGEGFLSVRRIMIFHQFNIIKVIEENFQFKYIEVLV